MIQLMQTTVLTVGLKGKSAALDSLPIQLFRTDTGVEAIQALRRHRVIDEIVARWDLPDMTDGLLIRRVKAARPWMPTIVLLDEPFEARELAVREAGVVAVLPSTTRESLLRRTVEQPLLRSMVAIAEHNLAADRFEPLPRSGIPASVPNWRSDPWTPDGDCAAMLLRDPEKGSNQSFDLGLQNVIQDEEYQQ